jgi:hypothetical protein
MYPDIISGKGTACDRLPHPTPRAKTPHRYARLALPRWIYGDRITFEPDNPDEWCDQFREQGFTALAHYSSAMNSDLTQQDPRLEGVSDRLKGLGVKVRSLNLQQFGSELEKIYRLCLVSFRQNFLYTPIAFSEFAAQYSQILPQLQPELVLMAEREGRLVGFLFAIPDLLQAKRGEKINTVIIKTVAVLPERQYAGLGNFLVAECQAAPRLK